MIFYVLRKPDEDKLGVTEFLPLEPHNTAEAPLCQACGNVLGMLPWLPPYKAELEYWGRTSGDIAFGPGCELLVSEKFKETFEKHKLTGLSNFASVQIVKVKTHNKTFPKKIPPYYCVNIARSKAAIDHKSSGLVLDEPWVCNMCHIGGVIKRTKKIVLETNTWSGEDIFFARGLPGTIITSERFKDFFDIIGIKSGVLTKASQYQFNHYPWENN